MCLHLFASLFVLIFADDHIVATEDMTIDELIESVLQGAATDTTSDANCNNGGCAPEPATSAVAITAVDEALIHTLWGTARDLHTIDLL